MRTALACIAFLLPTGPASAEHPCGRKDLIEQALGTRFGEAAFAMGMAEGNVVKFFTNPQSGSWTIVVVRPDGVACVAAQGENFELETTVIAAPSKLASLRN